MTRLLVFDVDGTLTPHKEPIQLSMINVLKILSYKYTILICAAGSLERVSKQLNLSFVDYLCSYGIEKKINGICFYSGLHVDLASISERVEEFRLKSGFIKFSGDSFELLTSGVISIPMLGTTANELHKSSFDVSGKIRSKYLPYLVKDFPDFNIYIGGRNSYDLVPKPFNKLFAINDYCRENNYYREEVIFFGDADYPNGNDEPVFSSSVTSYKVLDHDDLLNVLQKEFII